MTANFVAKVVQSMFDKIDIDEMSSEFDGITKYHKDGRITDEWVNKKIENKNYIRWVQSCYVLESFLQQNFTTFEETELVYRWGKQVCERRNSELIRFKGTPTFQSFHNWYWNKN